MQIELSPNEAAFLKGCIQSQYTQFTQKCVDLDAKLTPAPATTAETPAPATTAETPAPAT